MGHYDDFYTDPSSIEEAKRKRLDAELKAELENFKSSQEKELALKLLKNSSLMKGFFNLIKNF